MSSLVTVIKLNSNPANLLSNEEWVEMKNLKEEINFNPACVVPEKMERFTELFVRSLMDKGDNTHVMHDYNKYS